MRPQFIARNSQGSGVETHLLTANGCASQQAVILVDDAGERTVLWKRDYRLTLRPEELKREWITNARALHVDGHDTAAAARRMLGSRRRHPSDRRSR